MAYRPPRFTVPFRNEYEKDDAFEPTPLSTRRLPTSNQGFRAQYENPNAERGAGDYRSEIDKLYGTGEAMEKFYSHVQNVPRREDYSPGILGRITAGLAGVSAGWQGGAGAGIKTAQSVIRRPYEQAVEEYEMKGQGLKAAADIEQARDAKRVAYFKELREFNKDEYDRVYKEAQIENARITAEARAAQAETAARIATLTEARDKATDERERQKISAEIKKVENDLAIRTEANRIRNRGITAFEGRTGVMRDIGHERNVQIGKRTGQGKTVERVITPGEQRTAEIDATQTVLNKPEFQAMKPYVNLGSNFIDIKTSTGQWLQRKDIDPDLLDKFTKEVEKEKKKKLSQTIRLNDNKDDDDIIDLDLDDES